jgi:hypothetical protein
MLRFSICLKVAVRTLPVLTVVFGAYTVLAQPPSAATITAKTQALAKTNAI